MSPFESRLGARYSFKGNDEFSSGRRLSCSGGSTAIGEGRCSRYDLFQAVTIRQVYRGTRKVVVGLGEAFVQRFANLLDFPLLRHRRNVFFHVNYGIIDL